VHRHFFFILFITILAFQNCGEFKSGTVPEGVSNLSSDLSDEVASGLVQGPADADPIQNPDSNMGSVDNGGNPSSNLGNGSMNSNVPGMNDPGPGTQCPTSPLQNETKMLNTAVDKELIRANRPLENIDMTRCETIQAPGRIFRLPEQNANNYQTYMTEWYTYVQDLAVFSDDVVRLTDATIQQAAAACVLTKLHDWATTNALKEPDIFSDQGERERLWMMVSINLTFNKIKDVPGLNTRELQTVLYNLRWTLFGASNKYFENQFQNNSDGDSLFAYIALHNMLVGLNYYNFSSLPSTFLEGRLNSGLDWVRKYFIQIDDNGIIQRLNVRRGDAFLEHVRTVQALVYAAEVARLNGVDLYSENDGALNRLINQVITSFGDITHFQTLTGIEQNTTGADILMNQSFLLTWMEQVYARTANPTLLPWVRQLRATNASVYYRFSNTTVTHGLECL
jgi:poly(beta-D-mannuronate) lyase